MVDAPFWAADSASAPDAHVLDQISQDADMQVVLTDDCLAAVTRAAKSQGALWLYSFLYDKLRSDLSLLPRLDQFLRDNKACLENLELDKISQFEENEKNVAARDKVAYFHSALIGSLPDRFSNDEIDKFVKQLDKARCSDQGKVEAVTNLLKAPQFRKQVWDLPAAKEIIFAEPAQMTATHMYKVVFAFWMLSHDAVCMETLHGEAAPKLKKFLTSPSKAEKVVRLSLIVLQAFLKSPALTEDIASNSLLETVQSLGFEKWRDSDLYEQIRALGQSIQSAVSEVSNYDKYKKELTSGQFTRGYLHSAKFWAENYNNFKKEDVKELSNLLDKGNEETRAIACFDLGELAVLHRDGKKWIAEAHAKDKVMNLMGKGSISRETAREALLCCQKIMLKWQEVPLK
jgi:V-type H+-transporting ATPase subunit H